jgi:nucleoside-diphosphate-sugar epimerase
MYPNSEYPIKEDDFNSKIEDKYFGVGWTKVYIEKMLEFYSRISKTKFTAIRHSNIYGPYDKYDLDRSHVFGATVTKVLTSKENNFEVWGDGTEKRDLVYIDDLIKFVELIITKQKKQFELINLGSGKSISIAELVKKIIKASSKHLTIRYNNTKPTIKFNLELNIDKATKKYGWKPEVCLDEGIMKTMQWYKKNIKIYDYGKISLKKMIKKNV